MIKLIKKIISAPFIIVGLIIFLFGYLIMKGVDHTDKFVDHIGDFDTNGMLD